MARPESVKLLAAKSLGEVAAWLARGFYETARESFEDPFAPHSFIHLAEHPAEGIEELYGVASPELQRALRAGVVTLGSYCRSESREFAQLSEQQRLWLLSQFLRLTANLLCIRAAGIIAALACEDARHWPEAVFRQEVFPDCCVCLQTLGLGFAKSAYAGIEATREQPLRLELVDALKSVVRKVDFFDSSFAPRMLAALLGTVPSDVVQHLELLGPHMNEMHRRKPEQKQLAHLTATRIVSVAFRDLAQDFNKVQIGTEDARDTWLLDAMFCEQGPLIYWPISPAEIRVALSDYTDRRENFANDGLRTARLPPSSPPPDNLTAVALRKRLNINFFNSDVKVDIGVRREQASGHEYVH